MMLINIFNSLNYLLDLVLFFIYFMDKPFFFLFTMKTSLNFRVNLVFEYSLCFLSKDSEICCKLSSASKYIEEAEERRQLGQNVGRGEEEIRVVCMLL